MKHIRRTLVLAIVMSSALFIRPLYGESEVTQADVKLRQAALFKNGLGFFVSEVVCPEGKASFTIVPAAAALHGTFWVVQPPTVKLESLVAKEVELKKSTEAVTIEELLRANIGRSVWLSFDDKGESTIKGVIRSFAEDREAPPPAPYAPGTEAREVAQPVPRPLQATLIIIETEAGEVAINSQGVRRVQFLDGKPNKTFTSKSKSVQLDIQMAKPAGGKKLMLSYLAKGITWAPSYIVDITEPNKAVVSAKAVVINEVCDLNDVTIQLVTGFPNLQFADIVSPLAMKEKLAQFLQSLTRGQSERGRLLGVAGNVMAQRAASMPMEDREMAFMPSYGAAEAGKTSEDLFLYPIEKVNLAKGQTGYYPLFTESVAYKHIYEWKIPDYVNEDEQYSYQRRREQEQPEKRSGTA